MKYWKSSENSERLMEIIKKYETFAENSIDEMAKDGLVPSKDIKKCIWTDWKMLTAVCEFPKIEKKSVSNVFLKLLVNSLFPESYPNRYSQN